MQKIIINKKYYGKIEVPNTRYAPQVFARIKSLISQNKPVSLEVLFNLKKQKALQSYQKGGAQNERLELDFFIELGKILHFDTQEAQKLKLHIELTNDHAHTNFNISRRLQLFNKAHASQTELKFIFWDIENFANIGPMFRDLIDAYDIPDEHIYIAANPDSLYLYKEEWTTEFYDYGKNLYSFNFTKCDHGKNVADRVLLNDFITLNPLGADIYVMTYDRELKALFKESCSDQNNLFVIPYKG